jgi:cellulose synthase/poly-beta-1,6-N-acetylglucosamine synthase-like glycosyltransferase
MSGWVRLCLTTSNDLRSAVFAARETGAGHVALAMSPIADPTDAARDRPADAAPGRDAARDPQAGDAPDLGATPGRPDLSVIVVTHNRVALALSTLRSATAAVGALEVQWLVIDSGSTDGTPAAIEAALPEVRVLRERNIGFAAANNRGLEHARGRYVLLLNPDVEIDRGTFDELLATLDARPDIGVASVVQNAPDGRLQHPRRVPLDTAAGVA